jgi:transcriptional regulator with XRE-family HTH domain
VIDMGFLSVIRRWALRDKMPIREISRRTGLSRNTVKKYLREGAVEPKFKTPPRASKLDPYADRLSAWLLTQTRKPRKERSSLLGIGPASRLCGRSKSTISRAIKAGKLSASRDGAGYQIDPAELARVFPWNPATVAQPNQRNTTQSPTATPAEPSRDALATENKLLREMLDRECETVADLRDRLTRAETLIEDQRQTPQRRTW